MAHSFRHTPVIGITTARSDKPGKKVASRKLRKRVRMALLECPDFDNLVVPLQREVSDVWDFPKDGKRRMNLNDSDYCDLYRKYMRK
jgi:hypothetical protein